MKLQEVTINQKFTVTEDTTSTTVRQQRRMTNKNHFSDTDRFPKSTNSYNVNNKKTTCLKNSKSLLSPGTKENVEFNMKIFSQPSVKPSAKRDYTFSLEWSIVNPIRGFHYIIDRKKCQIWPPFSRVPPYFKYSDPDYI